MKDEEEEAMKLIKSRKLTTIILIATLIMGAECTAYASGTTYTHLSDPTPLSQITVEGEGRQLQSRGSFNYNDGAIYITTADIDLLANAINGNTRKLNSIETQLKSADDARIALAERLDQNENLLKTNKQDLMDEINKHGISVTASGTTAEPVVTLAQVITSTESGATWIGNSGTESYAISSGLNAGYVPIKGLSTTSAGYTEAVGLIGQIPSSRNVERVTPTGLGDDSIATASYIPKGYGLWSFDANGNATYIEGAANYMVAGSDIGRCEDVEVAGLTVTDDNQNAVGAAKKTYGIGELSTNVGYTLTLGTESSVTFPAGYYDQPIVVNNMVKNRGSLSLKPSEKDTYTYDPGYYDNISLDTTTIWDTAYNTGYAAHTFEGAEVKYQHHVHSLEVDNDCIENDDPSPSSVTVALPAGVYSDKGSYWSDTPGGCFTKHMYYYTYIQHWQNEDNQWSSPPDFHYGRCYIYTESPMYNQSPQYVGNGYWGGYNDGVQLIKEVYTCACGKQNGEVQGISVAFD